MTRLAWYEMDDEDRRIGSAQMVVWLACLGPALGLVVAIGSTFFGNRAFVTALAQNPLGVLLGLAWVGIYVVAGYLIGERRAAGGIIGLALFVYSLVQSALYGRLLSLNAAFAVVGIVLILRAGQALRLPFFPAPRSLDGPSDKAGGADEAGPTP
jgi:hypothetical protein